MVAAAPTPVRAEQHRVAGGVARDPTLTRADATLDDGYPTDIFVIVDGWENFLEDNTSLMSPEESAHRRTWRRLTGGGHGIARAGHVPPDWIKLGQGVPDPAQRAVRTEAVQQSDSSQVRARMEDKMVRPQDRIPADRPGGEASPAPAT